MVMLYPTIRGGLFKRPFFYPASDTSGGSSGAHNGGGKQEGGDNNVIVSPFATLPWDELDDESRASLKEAEKTFVATLQQQEQLKADLQKQTELAGRFQSEADKLKAEQAKQQKQQQQQNQPDPYLNAVQEQLLQAGYPEAEAAKLAPVFAGMFQKIGVIERKKIGEDLAPMGSAVLQTQASDAFQTAVSVDPNGMFQSDEIKQKVWAVVVERTKEGLTTTPEFVLNLGKIVFMDEVAEKRSKGEEFTFPTPTTANPPVRGTPQFSFPGSGNSSFSPIASPPVPANGARTTLDAETQAALVATFRTMGGEQGIYPKSLKDAITKPKRH